MRFCYQITTPDVKYAADITAYQGEPRDMLPRIAALGYDGVELMSIYPERLVGNGFDSLLEENGLCVAAVCTGELFGQLRMSLTDKDEGMREKTMERLCRIIDYAGVHAAVVNIGRVRGMYCAQVPSATTERMAVEAFCALSDYAARQGVVLALETVTAMQTNFVNTLEEAVALVEAVGRENFRLMMDVFHMNIEEKSLLDAISQFAGYCVHVHLADNNRRYPSHCGLNFPRVLERFHKHGYTGAFCIEVLQLPDQDTAAREASLYLQPLFRDIYGRKARTIAN